MSNSWDWVEKYNRRQRLWRFLRPIGVVGVIAMMVLVTGIIPLWHERKPVPPDADEPRQLSEEPFTSSTIDSEVHSGRKQETGNAVNADAPVTHAQQAAPQLAPPEKLAPMDQPAPSPPKMEPDPEAFREAQRAIADFERKVELLNQDSDWLGKYGGDKWRTIKAKAQSAKDATQPIYAIRLANEASRILDASLPDMYDAEFQAKTVGKKTSEFLLQVLEFRRKHADHPKIPALETSVRRFGAQKWLEVAIARMDQASPNDAGFVDGWQPIAGAWLLTSEDAEAREAIRRARESLPRMASVERAIESTIDLCQHPAFDAQFSKSLIQDAARMSEQVSDHWERSTYYSHLSGLATKFGLQSLAAELHEKSAALIKRDGLSSVWKKDVFTQEFRAAAWSEPPETILETTERIERLSYPKPTVNANGYAHAAMAAARHHDRRQFLRAMLMAETALAPLPHRSSPTYVFTARVAEANMLARRWRAAVIIANNIPDPSIRASLLFRVLRQAPQEVRADDLPELFESYGDQRWAVPAVAGYVEHRLRTGEELFSVIEWIQRLPLSSQRACGFVGIARVANSMANQQDPAEPNRASNLTPDIRIVASLVEEAQQIADSINDPMDSAFAWLQIARTWNLLGKTLRYQKAVAKVDDRCFEAWASVWLKRPPAKRSFDGTYSDGYSRHKEAEDATVGLIVACHELLSQMQADLGDAEGAMESCLNLADSVGFLYQPNTYYDMYFLHMEALTVRLHNETGVGPDVFSHTGNKPGIFSRAMVAAWSKDVPGLLKTIESLRQKSEGAELARAYSELAILYAERGNTAGYRDARRAALSEITERRAPEEMKCVLATADVIAGEFTLAEDTLVDGSMLWFGDASRPRTRLVVALAADGQGERAVKHAEKISEKYPVYRGDAWEAIAKARYKQGQSARETLIAWAGDLKPPNNRVGAFCGLALAVVATDKQ